MVGLFLIYFLAKPFYSLAEQYYKNKWLYAILGIISYYLSSFLGGVIVVVTYELALLGNIEELSDKFLNFISIPFGILGAWCFYAILKSQWSKVAKVDTSDLLDSGIVD